MTIFSQYYNNKKELISISMNEMNLLITDSSNKKIIANHIYERFYSRFLKIFDYQDNNIKEYRKNNINVIRNEFKEEFKNGFLQLASCSLLIETFAAFLTGENETPNRKSTNRFNEVFIYAKKHNNDLKIFHNTDFYQKIRCGILHQGETKGNYTVTRVGVALLKKDKIDAFLFHKSLKHLLLKYNHELENSNWDSEIWDNCRKKIRHIIHNSKNNEK
ncbi:MAG: hypothetical protein PSN34_15555 [Urechidicola sp.]|nr:hypothetical protein [Urechidicola sp.]